MPSRKKCSRKNVSKIALLSIMAVLISGCATTNKNTPPATNDNKLDATAAATTSATATPEDNFAQNDPYESGNRKIFAFNMAIDKAIFRPVAKGYNFIVPNPVQKGVGNFFSNIREVQNIANDLLQAKPICALSDAWRLILNTTVGIGGLFDVATPLGLHKHRQDFGLTLARWGAKDTPYIVIPLLGPSSIRDAVGIPFNILDDPVTYVKPAIDSYSLYALDFVSLRTSLLPTDKLVEKAFDPYVFVRDAYLQRRAHLIDINSGAATDGQSVSEATPGMTST